MAVGVRVNGLRDLIKRLDRAGVELSDLKAVMHDVGLMIADRASPPSATTSACGMMTCT